jgi:segregation and condensation protein A
MDASELLETITHLIHQAEQGEVDPWDVQVIEVIDRYLELMASFPTSRSYESELSQSGQAFLSASMLVLFKANTLMQMQAAAESVFVDEELLEAEDGTGFPREHFERHLRRRPVATPVLKRRVSLQELIEQLQIMANQLQMVQKAEKPVRQRRQSTQGQMRAALELAHQENLTETAGELEQVLQSWASELDLYQSWVNLEQLVELWERTKLPGHNGSGHHESKNSHLVGVFWALLLLSAQSKVELFQEEFYQEIKIRLLTDSTLEGKPFEQSMN